MLLVHFVAPFQLGILRMKGIPALPLFLAFLLSVTVTFGKSAPDQRKGGISPTFVRESKAEVPRGGEVVIQLVAIPSYGNAEIFEIQGQPVHGSLSDLKNTSDHTASVVYHHDGSKAPLEDGFTFRAKAPGQSLSAPAKAFIRIIPPPPLLVFEPRELDFGKVLLSEKRATNVVVINQGGGRATGRLLFPNGFSPTTGGGYQLAEGDRLSIEVEFSPMEAKSYEGDVKCIPVTEKGPLVVRGTGLPRFDVTPVSEATWSVRNLSGNPIRISFQPTGETGGWVLPPESLLPPDSQKAFTLLQEEEEDAQIRPSSTKVRITDGLTESLLELPPRRRFVPLTLQAVTPPILGNLSPGVGVPLSFCLVNRSDVPKRAFWKITSKMGGGMSESMRVVLNSGESREIQYLWTPSLPGEGHVRLAVEEGSKTRHELLWNAVVLGNKAAASPLVQDSRSQTMMPPAGDEQGGGVAISPEVPVRESTLPTVDDASIEISTPWVGKAEVVVRWKAILGKGGRIRVQECLLVPEEGQSPTSDTSAPNLSSMRRMCRDLNVRTMKDHGAENAAVISGLQPGWHLLMLSIQSDTGEPRACSRLNVRVPSSPSLWARLKMPLGIGAILLLFLFLRRIRNRGG